MANEFDAVPVIMDFALHAGTGPKITAQCRNTARLWSSRAGVWYNYPTFRECFTSEVFDTIANELGEAGSSMKRRHRLARHEWFRASRFAFSKLFNVLPLRREMF